MQRMLIFFLLSMLPGIVWAQAGRKKVDEGNKLFLEEKYEEASGRYRDALLNDPESPEINYNIAGSEYKIGKFEEALETYSKAMSPRLAEERSPEEERLLRSQVHYNRGNAYYRSNKLMEAINEYKEALKLNPGDEDAKYNLEFVRNKLKNQSQNQDQQQQQQQNQQQQQEQQQQQQNQQNEEQKKEQEQQEQEQQEQEQQQEQDQQEQQQQQQMEEMSKEDAERILNALKDDEKNEQEKRKMKAPISGQVLKDW